MFYRLFIIACLAAGLAQFGCVPTAYQRPGGEISQPEMRAMAARAWSQYAGTNLPAVDDLMQQADALVAAGNLDAASEKIERALRIAPHFAPAWSRMASIALAGGNPARAIQMAKRSNSHAGNSAGLKKLNWEFIRQASMQLNDIEGVENADRAIGILNSL